LPDAEPAMLFPSLQRPHTKNTARVTDLRVLTLDIARLFCPTHGSGGASLRLGWEWYVALCAWRTELKCLPISPLNARFLAGILITEPVGRPHLMIGRFAST